MSATLSEWDGVGQGLRQLVVEKDKELQALRTSTAEQKVGLVTDFTPLPLVNLLLTTLPLGY